MKKKKFIVLITGLILSAPLWAGIEVVTFDAEEDAYVDSIQIDATFNNEQLHIQGFDNDPFPGSDVASDQRSFLKFDVSSLEGKTVVGAYFGVYVDDYSDHTAPSAQLYYLDNDGWNEDTITWTSSQPIIATAAAVGIGQQLNSNRYYEWTLYKKDSGFEDFWEDSDILDGFAGYMLTISNEEINNYAYFSSSGYANQPYLRIEYIPEPATLFLLGLGTLFLQKTRSENR